MSILINKDTRLIVQGITGRDGSFHATKMKEYGTNVVGGTSPGKAGEEVAGIPVFNTVRDAVEATNANTSVIFVPAAFAKDAMLEAADAGIKLIICITEGVPTLDVVEAYRYIQIKGAQLIGPNCPGLISPGESMVGIMPTNIFKKGHTGVISRSGTLTYQVVAALTAEGLGQSSAIGVGGDPIVGLYFQELLEMFQNDPETDSIAIIGEIGGDAEERAAEYIKQYVTNLLLPLFLVEKHLKANKWDMLEPSFKQFWYCRRKSCSIRGSRYPCCARNTRDSYTTKNRS